MIRLTLCGLLIATPVAAQASFQDVSLVDRAVESFTGKPIGAEGGARTGVDTRLKLAACPMVAMSWRSPAHDAVVVSCSSPEWRLYVSVLMPVAPVAPPTASAAAKAEIVIKRGDPVTIEAGATGFSITREGIAMSEASAGGRFLVNVDDARKPIQAIALQTGRATLPGYTQ